MPCFFNERRFEVTKILLRFRMYQRQIHDEQRVVSGQCERIRRDAGARLDGIRNRLPPIAQRIRQTENRIWITNACRKTGRSRIAAQCRGKSDAVAAVPRRIFERGVPLCRMKYVDDLIERSQINGNRRRTNSASNQARDLGGNRVRSDGKARRGWLIGEPRSHCASKSLKPYLNGIVQTVVAAVVAPKRNNGANAIVLQ